MLTSENRVPIIASHAIHGEAHVCDVNWYEKDTLPVWLYHYLYCYKSFFQYNLPSS